MLCLMAVVPCIWGAVVTIVKMGLRARECAPGAGAVAVRLDWKEAAARALAVLPD